ncbi:MAG: LysM peptidoglycan-binding domain-containing protein [Acidiferrobacterales bacterium]
MGNHLLGPAPQTSAGAAPASLTQTIPAKTAGPATVAANAIGGVINPGDLVTTAIQGTVVPGTTANTAAPGDTSNQKYADLWDRVRAGFSMPPMDGPRVQRQEQWFANNPEYMGNMLTRARFYLYYIVQEVQKRKMPMEIALLPAIESAYQPHAYSRARAVGLWQFMASTGRLYGLKDNWWYDGRRDVTASTDAALDYLDKLKDDFNGDWQLALAAYNCGEGKVQYAINYNQRHGLPTDYSHLRLPRETENYIPKLMAMVHIVSDPAKFGLKFAAIPNIPYFARVDTGTQVDLGVVAKLTDMPVTDLYQINPAYIHWVTEPNGPHELLVPADKKEAVLEGLSNLPENERVQWSHHVVRRGDTLSQIARRFRVTVAAIRTSNRLHSNFLRLGQNLLIPVSMSRIADISPPGPPRAYREYHRYHPYHRYHAYHRNRREHSGHIVRVVHRVRPGDTLWSIARKYNVYVHQLRRWNLMDTKDVLHLGQHLRIWVRSYPAAALTRFDAGRG